MLRVLVTAAMLMAAAAGEASETLSAGDVITKSIAYHDPSGIWATGGVQLTLHTSYSEDFAKRYGAEDADLSLLLAPGQEDFRYVKETAKDKIEIRLVRGEGSTLVNGSAEVSDQDRERLRLREPVLYRDYCEYLYGMPMKLRDPGTILAPHVERVRFDDREVLQLEVTYDPEVGQDTWYFYFDPSSFALVGYRFYKDPAANDGEYIVFEGEAVDPATGLRLPRTRAWYYNADHGHLATDDIVSVRTTP